MSPPASVQDPDTAIVQEREAEAGTGDDKPVAGNDKFVAGDGQLAPEEDEALVGDDHQAVAGI